MSLTKITITFSLILAFHFSIAQNEALNVIDKNDLKIHLNYIASDELLGRELGADNDGLEKTAQYIADFAHQIGLKPAVDNYFQKVGLISVTPDDNPFIEIRNQKGKSVFHSNEIVNLNGVDVPGLPENNEIVLAGFGIKEFTNQEMEGKIVVIAQGNEKTFQQKENVRWNNRMEKSKIDGISDKSPKAIILITNSHDKKNKTFNQIKVWFNRQRFQFESNEKKEVLPIIIATPDFADALLAGKGKYEKYLASIVRDGLPSLQSVKNKNIAWKLNTITKPVNAKNIIGMVEGSDEELKKECVVIMAHYDHLGVDENGDVFNGADDNGSGTVTVMEVAKAFASLKQKPKRSILFLWVTGEEVGMMGSQYYAQNPVFPLDKTVTCINIDMDGRVYEPRDSVWKNSPKMVKDFDGLFTLQNNIWPGLKEINDENCKTLGLIPDYSLPDNFLRSSDHYSFHNKGVPILNYATGYHADYHKVSDEVSKINFDKMKRVADLCFLVSFEIANRDTIHIENNKGKRD